MDKKITQANFRRRLLHLFRSSNFVFAMQRNVDEFYAFIDYLTLCIHSPAAIEQEYDLFITIGKLCTKGGIFLFIL